MYVCLHAEIRSFYEDENMEVMRVVRYIGSGKAGERKILSLESGECYSDAYYHALVLSFKKWKSSLVCAAEIACIRGLRKQCTMGETVYFACGENLCIPQIS